MVKTIATTEKMGFEWIDIVQPGPGDIETMAARFGLHRASIQDAMQPDHLPKYESFKNYRFVIIRVYTQAESAEADTVQELTDKIAIFVSDRFLISIHQKPWSGISQIEELLVQAGECRDSGHLFNEIVRYGLMSYEDPAAELGQTIDYLEEQVFLRSRNEPLLRNLYFLKRKVDVIRRMILLSHELIEHIDPPGTSNEYTRDIRDLYIKQQSLFDSLAENTTHLLAMYFNVSSQRTNETIRVLTIFSVFFMPLTFIVGIYGMNFRFMPELNQRWGYPGVMILMLVVVIAIFIWFRQKKWL